MKFKEFLNDTLFLYESDLSKEIENRIKNKVKKFNMKKSISRLKTLNDKVKDKKSSTEEGAEYHFLKMHIKQLWKKEDPKRVINTIDPRVGFKTVSVRALSDYGYMENPTEDYTKKEIPEKLLHSIGNTKIGSDTIIFNMGSAKDCPSRKKGLCQVCSGGGKCYALKTELMRSGDVASATRKRRLQGEQWKKFSIDELARQFKEIARNNDEIKYLRINESGDFNNQSDVDKASKLADELKGALKVYMYTARKDLDFSKKSDNLIINGSGFMVDNEFRFIPKSKIKEIKEEDIICPGDCSKCTYCKEKKKRVIKVKEH